MPPPPSKLYTGVSAPGGGSERRESNVQVPDDEAQIRAVVLLSVLRSVRRQFSQGRAQLSDFGANRRRRRGGLDYARRRIVYRSLLHSLRPRRRTCRPLRQSVGGAAYQA